jgi:hypothetical protein
LNPHNAEAGRETEDTPILAAGLRKRLEKTEIRLDVHHKANQEKTTGQVAERSSARAVYPNAQHHHRPV